MVVAAVVLVSVVTSGFLLSRGLVPQAGVAETGASVMDVAPTSVALRFAPSGSSLRDEPESEPTVPVSGRGMELLESLPKQVEPFVLMEVSSSALDGALESYTGVYARTDASGNVVGDDDVVLTVSRWATEADAARELAKLQARFAQDQAAELATLDAAADRKVASSEIRFDDEPHLTIVWADFTTAGTITGIPKDARKLFNNFRLGPDSEIAGDR